MTPAPQPAAQPKRRWFQFSVRGLLIGTAVVAVGLAILDWRWIEPAQRRRAAVKMVERLGGKVKYADVPWHHRVHESWATQKLRNWLPREYFDDVQVVSLTSTRVTDAELFHLKGLVALKYLELNRTPVTDAGLVHIREVTSLEWLYLKDTKVTDVGLVHLRELRKLKRLDLDGLQVTDAGLVHLSGLTALTGLSLVRTQVTDIGLVHLKELTLLRWLYLDDSPVSQKGVANLNAALPRCTIVKPARKVVDAWVPQYEVTPLHLQTD